MVFNWWGQEYTGEPIPKGKKFKEGALVYYKVEKIPLILRFNTEGKGRVLAWDEYRDMYLVGISRGVVQLHEDELTIRKGRR